MENLPTQLSPGLPGTPYVTFCVGTEDSTETRDTSGVLLFSSLVLRLSGVPPAEVCRVPQNYVRRDVGASKGTRNVLKSEVPLFLTRRVSLFVFCRVGSPLTVDPGPRPGPSSAVYCQQTKPTQLFTKRLRKFCFLIGILRARVKNKGTGL